MSWSAVGSSSFSCCLTRRTSARDSVGPSSSPATRPTTISPSSSCSGAIRATSATRAPSSPIGPTFCSPSTSATTRWLGFADEAEADGWRVHRVAIAGRVSVPRLVLAALEAVTTTYVIRMDGDTRPAEHPGEAIAAVRQGQADLASVKVRASRRRTVMEKLQAVEYDMAMLGRHLRPWMTSGACMIGRAAALRQILPPLELVPRRGHRDGSHREPLPDARAARRLRRAHGRPGDVQGMAEPAAHVVVRQLPNGVRERRPDDPLPPSRSSTPRASYGCSASRSGASSRTRRTSCTRCPSSCSSTRGSARPRAGRCGRDGWSPSPTTRSSRYSCCRRSASSTT